MIRQVIEGYNATAMPRKTSTGYGGRREGAGRKRVVQDPERIAVDLERPDLDALRAIGVERETSVANLIRLAVAQFLKRAQR